LKIEKADTPFRGLLPIFQFSIFNFQFVIGYTCARNNGDGGRATDMKTWEYKIINVRSENYSMDPRRAEELNRLGDEGWELVSITSINFKTGATDHIGMVFKREKAAPA
jgi:hypothetical protein